MVRRRVGESGQAAIRAAGYIRVSTEDQAEAGYSLASQERSIAAYCAAQEWELATVYRDEGESGAKSDRPGLVRLLADVRAGGIDRIVATKLDRLGRSVRHVLALYDELECRGVGVVLVRDNIETTTAHGRLFRTIMAAMAEFEREMIAERVQSGRIEKARQGGHLGGFLPLGYRRDAPARWCWMPPPCPLCSESLLSARRGEACSGLRPASTATASRRRTAVIGGPRRCTPSSATRPTPAGRRGTSARR